jgi:hypothetical protein
MCKIFPTFYPFRNNSGQNPGRFEKVLGILYNNLEHINKYQYSMGPLFYVLPETP